MDPFRRRPPDRLLDHVDERRGLVIGDGLPGPDGVDGEFGPFPDGGGVGGGDDPQLGPGFAREDLHLEPVLEPGLVGEETGDFRQCVAVYQGGPSSCRTLYEPAMARTAPGDGRGPRAIGASQH